MHLHGWIRFKESKRLVFLKSVNTKASKDAEYPFPWKSVHGTESVGTSTKQQVGFQGGAANLDDGCSSSHQYLSKPPLQNKVVAEYLQRFPTLTGILLKCEAEKCISFQLPAVQALAGSVVRHSSSVLENLFGKWSPLIFKIGFTHDPIWRWSNTKYGYRWEAAKWDHMIIFYLANEPFGPSMLEAALIDKFRSNFVSI